MCLIAFALHADPGCPLLIAANRDEFLDRPTAALHRWSPGGGVQIVAGRDLRDGGTWLGLSPGGRVAMLTNVRQAGATPGTRSRGELVTRWLLGDDDEDALARVIDPAAYGGFNLVVGDFHRQHWSWLSNRDPGAPHEQRPPGLYRKSLAAGIYGLSNASLDTPWPKTQRLKQAVGHALAALRDPCAAEGGVRSLAQSLADRAPAEAPELPRTGVPHDMERALSSPFVHMPERAYGTRSSLVVSARRGDRGWAVHMDEWTHDHAAPPTRALDAALHRRETLAW